VVIWVITLVVAALLSRYLLDASLPLLGSPARKTIPPRGVRFASITLTNGS